MALRTVRNHPPDAILLDIKMPHMDSYQVCEALKSDENTSEIPIIFLSALDQFFDKVKAFKVGELTTFVNLLSRKKCYCASKLRSLSSTKNASLKKQSSDSSKPQKLPTNIVPCWQIC